jgi:hypothetical protein
VRWRAPIRWLPRRASPPRGRSGDRRAAPRSPLESQPQVDQAEHHGAVVGQRCLEHGAAHWIAAHEGGLWMRRGMAYPAHGQPDRREIEKRQGQWRKGERPDVEQCHVVCWVDPDNRNLEGTSFGGHDPHLFGVSHEVLGGTGQPRDDTGKGGSTPLRAKVDAQKRGFHGPPGCGLGLCRMGSGDKGGRAGVQGPGTARIGRTLAGDTEENTNEDCVKLHGGSGSTPATASRQGDRGDPLDRRAAGPRPQPGSRVRRKTPRARCTRADRGKAQ